MKYEILEYINALSTGYNSKKYWKYHFKFIDTSKPTLLRYYFLFRMKRMENKNGSSFGHRMGCSPTFAEPPCFPHGIRGIFIATHSRIGRNVTIYQQVSIAQKMPDDKSAPVVGDNVLIGAGAKIIGDIHIGNNVKIGAGAVVVHDVPDNCTVVGNPAKVIQHIANI